MRNFIFWPAINISQGSTCLEVGVYMLNYAGCHACKSKSFIDAAEKNSEEEEGGSEETITYKRVYTTMTSFKLQ